MLDDNDVHRLAGMAHALRPDWPLKSLVTFIGKNLAGRAFRDVAVALSYIACEKNTATPKRILEAGPWWRATATDSTTPRPPRKSETCPVHPGSWADNCSGCRADQLAGDQTTGPNLRRPDVSDRVAQVRAEIRAKGVSA